MKENKKGVSVLIKEGDPNKSPLLPDVKGTYIVRLKKVLIFSLMGIVCIGCMYLIFKLSSKQKEIENIGLNDSVPQPSDAAMQVDKQKAYEQEMLEEKEQQKRNTLMTLSDYWNEDTSNEKAATADQENQNNNYNSNSESSKNPAVNSYRSAQSTLGSFYQNDNTQSQKLQKQLDELKQKLAEKEVPASVTTADQLALMEKSYQMAAKYLPIPTNNNETTSKNGSVPAAAGTTQAASFASFTPARKSGVSALYREPTDSTFLTHSNENSNRQFYTAGSVQQTTQPKNSVKACVLETQTIISEGNVHLRLLEPAQTSNRTIAKGTILTANAKIQAGRLQLKVTSIEVDGSIIPVEIIIYDLDGQQGLNLPYSPEINALSEMAGNMSQTSGTSLMLTQSAGQQMAADLSRGVVQGISGYFSKKVKTPKVTLKTGHQLFLVAKKQ
jgi:conjugative transposon TraM protein